MLSLLSYVQSPRSGQRAEDDTKTPFPLLEKEYEYVPLQGIDQVSCFDRNGRSILIMFASFHLRNFNAKSVNFLHRFLP